MHAMSVYPFVMFLVSWNLVRSWLNFVWETLTNYDGGKIFGWQWPIRTGTLFKDLIKPLHLPH